MKYAGLIAGIVSAVLGFSNVAHADDCWTMLQKHFTWAQADSYGSNHNLAFKLATNNSGSQYVSYASGIMDVATDNPWLFTTALTGISYSGVRHGTQYFSDRWYPGCYYPYWECPFNRDATDVLGVRMTWNGEMTLTLRSWGGNEMTGTGVCSNEMLSFHVGNTMFVFSFRQNASPKVY